MRDLLYKKLTSDDKKRKIISSSEIVDREGMRSVIRRHFVCLVKEIGTQELEKNQKPLLYLYVLKEHYTREQKEKFFCKLKGSIYAVNQGRLFLIIFMHTLRIVLTAVPQDLAGCDK
jgi:hypothetical protein